MVICPYNLGPDTAYKLSHNYKASACKVTRFHSIKDESHAHRVEAHGSVGSVADLRIGGRWFDPLLGQYSFRG